MNVLLYLLERNKNMYETICDICHLKKNQNLTALCELNFCKYRTLSFLKNTV